MRGLILAAIALSACSNNQPPPIGDPDGAVSQFTDDAYAPPVFVDSGVDAGVTEQIDFAGTCTSGLVPIWHFFDFQTHTPTDSALDFSASSAVTQAGLDTAPSVHLATVTGPDITVWTGVDVDPQLQSIGQTSKLFLRVRVTFTSASDGTAPELVHYRQQYDCIVGQ